MIELRPQEKPIMKRTDPDGTSAPPVEVRSSREDETKVDKLDGYPDDSAAAAGITLTTGALLWTMSKDRGIARARCWMTRRGWELEVQFWTGPQVEGQEDLSLSQLFTTEPALVRAAQAKKRQLQSAGWVEDVDGHFHAAHTGE